MHQNTKTKKFMTLIEIMVVMFLISIVAGLATYKIKDSIDYGKAFKTHQNMLQLERILEMGRIKGQNSNWEEILNKSPLADNKSALKKDGWGKPWKDVKYVDSKKKWVIESTAFKQYMSSHDVWFDEQDGDE